MSDATEVTVTVLNGFDEIEPEEWNRLVECSATRSVFQTWQWHRAWWDVFGGGLRLILLCAGDKRVITGIAACVIDAAGVVRFVGHGRSDYADIICPGDRADVRSALLRAIGQVSVGWKRIELANLPANSPTVSAFSGLGLHVLTTNSMPCPTLLIEGHADDFARVRKKKSLRRHLNRFRKEHGYQVSHFAVAADIQPQLEQFFDQHVGRWAGTESTSLFCDQINRDFYRSVTEALDGTGWLRFTRLMVGDEPIAFHFGFAYGGKFFWYKPSFEAALARRSPGEALLAELFELAAGELAVEFDFTVGDEPFKQRFTNHVRHNVTLIAFRSPIGFQLRRAIEATKGYLKASPLGNHAFVLAKRLLRRR